MNQVNNKGNNFMIYFRKQILSILFFLLSNISLSQFNIIDVNLDSLICKIENQTENRLIDSGSYVLVFFDRNISYSIDFDYQDKKILLNKKAFRIGNKRRKKSLKYSKKLINRFIDLDLILRFKKIDELEKNIEIDLIKWQLLGKNTSSQQFYVLKYNYQNERLTINKIH